MESSEVDTRGQNGLIDDCVVNKTRNNICVINLDSCRSDEKKKF